MGPDPPGISRDDWLQSREDHGLEHGHLAKRHYFTCGGETLSWEASWYTEPFYTSNRASYDSAASLGPVEPPTSVIDTISACSAAASEASALSTLVSILTSSSTLPAVVTTTVKGRTTSAGIAMSTTFTETITSNAPMSTNTVTGTSSVSTSAFASSNTALSSPSSITTSSSASAASASTTTSTTSMSVSLVSTTSGVSALGQATNAASINTCAGGWDWQGWGVVAGLGTGMIVGGALWLCWAILRPRLPGLYSPRSWFIGPNGRPSSGWSLAAFLIPFLHMPSLSSGLPLSEGQHLLHGMFSCLKLASITSLVALAGVIPLIVAGVPCLATTAPSNTNGGRLGTLTDLSLLRLLDALDPSPGSTNTSGLLELPPYFGSFLSSRAASLGRALMSTVAPAIGSARVRLIVILVLIAVIGCIGGLWVVSRAYAAFARYRTRFEMEICGGMDMVIVSAQDAPGWRGMSEEKLKKWFKDKAMLADESDGKRSFDVVGLFAVPDTAEWRNKLKERDLLLERMELAEARYIRSFHLVQTASNGRRLESVHPEPGEIPSEPHSPTDFVAPKQYYKVSSGRQAQGSREHLDVPLPTSLGSLPKARPRMHPQSRFLEVNRDSSLFSKRFSIGQRIKIDDLGQYVPDPSPESEGNNPLGSSTSHVGLGGTGSSHGHGNPPSSHGHDLYSEAGPSSAAHPGAAAEEEVDSRGEALEDSRHASTGAVPSRGSADFLRLQEGPQRRVEIQSGLPELQPGPERRAQVLAPPTAAVVASARASQEETSPLGLNYEDIRETRARMKALNAEITSFQQRAFGFIATGEGVIGWVIVGRGVRYLAGAQRIEGNTREDILWANVGSRTREGLFWVKILAIGIVLGIIIVPIIALTVGTAPGFAHYLGLFKPLERSNGFGSGVVEGLVPALALSLIVGIAVYATNRFARQVRVISKTRQRLLAYKATFYLLLSATLFWLFTVAALEFGLQNLTSGVQSARFVGDGAIFSTWFIFVLLLNIAIIIPALYLLQPIRLWRYARSRRRVITPRQRFRLHLPPSFNPSFAFLPFLIAVFYAFSLIFIFPLLAIPIMLLIILSFIATRYMIDHVFVERSGEYTNAILTLWTLGRFGLLLATQPFLYGLLLLSRREWALGGASLGVAAIALILATLLTVVRFAPPRRRDLPPKTRRLLDDMAAEMRQEPPTTARSSQPRRSNSTHRRLSDSSMLLRLAALLPGYSRLPPDCPVPLPSEDIDDLFFTERAAYARPSRQIDEEKSNQLFYDPSEGMRGLIYPPEMLAPRPVIWLPYDSAGVAESEASDLQRHHQLPAIVDPSDGKDKTTLHESSIPRTRIEDVDEQRNQEPAEPAAELNSPLLA